MATLTMPDGAVYSTGDDVAKDEWDGAIEAAVVKSVDEKQYTLSVGYPAYSPDIAKSRDGHIDFASAEELEKAAWDYLRSGAKVGVLHADGTEGAGDIVESYLWPEGAPDWPQDNGYVVKSGDWLIGTVWDDRTWAAIKRGDLRGTSMQGTAKRRAPSPADLAKIKGAQRG